MSHALSALVARTTRAVAPAPAATDGELLAQFVRTRAEAVFAELVRRLGPLVLGACRRVVSDPHAAEDAFQAAFLVLVRRAGDVRPAEAVRAWLYGVAVRCAKEARTVNARRRQRETPVATLPDRAGEPAPAPDTDALGALDEEIALLPEHLRAAVVLCELDGLSRKDASLRLGIAEGTLSSRLAKARKLLAERLRTRGLAFGAGALVALAHATVSPRLSAQTSALASTGAAISPAVAALAHGVFRTMFLHRLSVTGVVAALLAMCALAANPDAPPKPADPPTPVVLVPVIAQEKKAPAAKPAAPDVLVLGREGAYWAITPEGKKLHEHPVPEGLTSCAVPSVSPDGKTVALLFLEPRPPEKAKDFESPWPYRVAVRALDDPKKEKLWELSAHGLTVRWTADGKKLVASKEIGVESVTFESVLLDPITGKTEALDLPDGVRVLDCGKDGKTFVVEWRDSKTKKKHLGLTAIGEKEVRTLAELKGPPASFQARLSPDGTTILFTDGDPERKNAHKWGISHRPHLLDVKTKKREPLGDFPDNGQATGIAWAPDGKRIAYTWRQLHDEVLKKDRLSAEDAAVETEGFLMVADPDGRNAKTIATDKTQYATNGVFGSIDWR